jgi:hypothetical protein
MFDSTPITGGQGGDMWAMTLASHFKINPKTTFRPEIRYDHANYNNDAFSPFGNGTKNDQLSGGVSLIVVF